VHKAWRASGRPGGTKPGCDCEPRAVRSTRRRVRFRAGRTSATSATRACRFTGCCGAASASTGQGRAGPGAAAYTGTDSPAATPALEVPDGGASYRALVADLRLHLFRGDEGGKWVNEASQLILGLIQRVTVMPAGEGESQPIEIESGSSMTTQPAEQYCESGCGGPQVSQSTVCR
jgi:hypothetical protein